MASIGIINVNAVAKLFMSNMYVKPYGDPQFVLTNPSEEAINLRKQQQKTLKGEYNYPLAFRREYILVLANETYAVYELYLNADHRIEYTINDGTGEITQLKSLYNLDLHGGIQATATVSNLITIKQFWSNLL